MELAEPYLPTLATALNFPERRQRIARLQHRVGVRRPTLKTVIVPDKQPTGEDVAIAERLLAAYRLAGENGPVAPDGARPDLWTLFYAQQAQFASVIARGTASELAAYLCNMSRHDATIGIAQGDEALRRASRDRPFRNWTGLVTQDRLVSLAEAVGALELENPDDLTFRANVRSDPAMLVEAIGRRLGIDIAPPDVDGGHFKLATPHGLFSERDLWAIFTAHLVQRTLQNLGSANAGAARVCELGAGVGRAAYWASRLGLRSYTIIDLPHINVVQGYYLLKCLPKGEVALYGEREVATGDQRIRILPHHAVSTVGGHEYDLILNQDSLPEMSPSIVDEYLVWIKDAAAAGLLLSINQESKKSYNRRRLAQVSVPEAVERIGGFKRLDRYPYWLRRGYVTEIYRVDGGAGDALEDLHVGAVADNEAVGLR